MADISAEARRRAAARGQAMQGGRFPVRNRADLQNAIRAVGRVRPNTEAARARVRRHVIRRARALNAMSMIPESWSSDGTLRG